MNLVIRDSDDVERVPSVTCVRGLLTISLHLTEAKKVRQLFISILIYLYQNNDITNTCTYTTYAQNVMVMTAPNAFPFHYYLWEHFFTYVHIIGNTTRA